MDDPGGTPRRLLQTVPLTGWFAACFWIGLFSFGGGLTGWVHREVVFRRRWMSEEDFLSGVALSQILPGTNISNLVVYIGQRLHGALGAFLGVAGLLLGPFFVVISLGAVYSSFAGVLWLNRALDGVTAAAVGLLLLAAFKGVSSLGVSMTSSLVLIFTFVTVGLLQWPLVPVVLGVAPVSIFLAWLRIHHE